MNAISILKWKTLMGEGVERPFYDMRPPPVPHVKSKLISSFDQTQLILIKNWQMTYPKKIQSHSFSSSSSSGRSLDSINPWQIVISVIKYIFDNDPTFRAWHCEFGHKKSKCLRKRLDQDQWSLSRSMIVTRLVTTFKLVHGSRCLQMYAIVM